MCFCHVWGFGSRLDPDSVGSLDPDPGRQKKLRNSCFEVLEVLFGGLEASPVAWKNKNIFWLKNLITVYFSPEKVFFTIKSLNFLSSKPGSGSWSGFTKKPGSWSAIEWIRIRNTGLNEYTSFPHACQSIERKVSSLELRKNDDLKFLKFP